jgi:hypothetical protein
MGKRKWVAVLALPFLLASFLQSQSVVELAKKEKARRAALKGKTATVITTADLAKVKKRPAVETRNEELAAEETINTTGAEEQAQEGTAPPGAAEQTQGAATETATAEAPKPETAPEPGPPALSEADYRAKQAALTKTAQDKQEFVDLLTLKMNSLYQELYSLDNMKSRELLQAQISDTYDKLLQAEVEAKQAAKDLEDFLATTKKQETPSIWIR